MINKNRFPDVPEILPSVEHCQKLVIGSSGYYVMWDYDGKEVWLICPFANKGFMAVNPIVEKYTNQEEEKCEKRITELGGIQNQDTRDGLTWFWKYCEEES